MIEGLEIFLLFGVIEIFIMLMFYKIVGNVKEVKYRHGVLLSIPFLTNFLLIFPYFKQILIAIIFALYLHFISGDKIKSCLVLSIKSSMYLLCVEAPCCILYMVILNIDMVNCELFIKFLYMIPIRILEILFLVIYKHKRKNRRN